MKLFLRPSLRHFKLITFLALFVFLLLYFVVIGGWQKNSETFRKVEFIFQENSSELAVLHDKAYPVVTNYQRKDWHDWKFINYEKNREGPGENGKSFKLTDPEEIELNKKLFKTEGLYVVVSDKISVNRSVPDTRLPQ